MGGARSGTALYCGKTVRHAAKTYGGDEKLMLRVGHHTPAVSYAVDSPTLLRSMPRIW